MGLLHRIRSWWTSRKFDKALKQELERVKEAEETEGAYWPPDDKPLLGLTTKALPRKTKGQDGQMIKQLETMLAGGK